MSCSLQGRKHVFTPVNTPISYYLEEIKMTCPTNEYLIVINVYNLMTLGAILVLASLAKTLRYSLGKPTWFFYGRWDSTNGCQ